MKHIKTFESFSSDFDKVEKIEEGLLADFGHWLGFDAATRKKIKSDLEKMDFEDSEAVDKLFFSVFPEEDVKKPVKSYLDKATIEEKIEILKEASNDKDGIGVLSFTKDGKLAYKPSSKINWSREDSAFNK